MTDSINIRETAVFRQSVNNQAEDVSGLLDQLEARRVFLVTDAGAWNLSGAAERLSPSLAKHEVTIFADFEPNPKLPDVQRGMEAFQQAQVDVVLAVGGGSAQWRLPRSASLRPAATFVRPVCRHLS